MDWSLDEVVAESAVPAVLHSDIEELVGAVAVEARSQDQIVIMSNGSFGGVHQKLLDALENQYADA